MKRVTKETKFSLKKGMALSSDGVETVILTSDYLPFHGGYTYHDTEITEEGDLIELETGHILTANEIVGYYYY